MFEMLIPFGTHLLLGYAYVIIGTPPDLHNIRKEIDACE